jgi:hypothetical protein
MALMSRLRGHNLPKAPKSQSISSGFVQDAAGKGAPEGADEASISSKDAAIFSKNVESVALVRPRPAM